MASFLNLLENGILVNGGDLFQGSEQSHEWIQIKKWVKKVKLGNPAKINKSYEKLGKDLRTFKVSMVESKGSRLSVFSNFAFFSLFSRKMETLANHFLAAPSTSVLSETWNLPSVSPV